MCAALLSQTSPLKPLLYDLVYRAQKRPDVPQGIQFSNEILVEVMYHQGRVHLQVSRADRFPTHEEYQDILSCWPYGIHGHEPKPTSHSGRKYLTSVWPTLSLPSF
jgi:hypothetical protein